MFFGTGDPARRRGDGRTVLLDRVSVAVPAGALVAVVDLGGASRQAFLRIVANAMAPDRGKVVHRGRVIVRPQLRMAGSAHETVRANLLTVAELLGLQRREMAAALPSVEAFAGATEMLDLPLRRVPREKLNDILLGVMCCAPFDTLVIEDIGRIASPGVEESWRAFLRDAPALGKTLFFSGRRLADAIEASSHLLLLKDGRLLDFGPASEVEHRHAAFVEEAIATPQGPLETGAEEAEDEDDEEDDGDLLEDDGFAEEPPERAPSKKSRSKKDGDRPVLLSREWESYSKKDRTRRAIRQNQIGGADYVSARSDLGEIPGPETAWLDILLADGAPAVPQPERPDVEAPCRHLPAVFLDEGFCLGFRFRTPVDDLRIRPGLDLLRNKNVLTARSFGEPIVLPEAGTYELRATVPPGLLGSFPFTVTAFVAVDRARRQDIVIRREPVTFLAIPRAPRPPAASVPGTPGPVFSELIEIRDAALARSAEGVTFGKLEARGRDGRRLEEDRGAPGTFVATAGEPLRLRIEVPVTRPLGPRRLRLALIADNKTTLVSRSAPAPAVDIARAGLLVIEAGLRAEVVGPRPLSLRLELEGEQDSLSQALPIAVRGERRPADGRGDHLLSISAAGFVEPRCDWQVTQLAAEPGE
ncbi:ABC-type polysaccharide/polyol phosphate transport system, ATPase component [Tistlia consotensis]|uniref:ABC-type polysaccharide/polyol phosphate transport system, ATPase component n=1 Tax=Tistlia consotensis USBA 355 TaxID=560819 RepID=A0A1Y6B8Y7_9PROT|nr:hypothetical protein [Tistlia consotensis]SME99059.1 ABC-type polysaccharide/polyol phosphate transport system, ATPase component [Tistlia consotensis USBA 355]SNR77442.1 ABC-type polysaccharide/polyol phosphate transport system, ATPase component [Tistlia consotensis]